MAWIHQDLHCYPDVPTLWWEPSRRVPTQTMLTRKPLDLECDYQFQISDLDDQARAFLLRRAFKAWIVRKPVKSIWDRVEFYGTVVYFVKNTFDWPQEWCILTREPHLEVNYRHRVLLFQDGKVTAYRTAQTFAAFRDLAEHVIMAAKPKISPYAPKPPEPVVADMSDEDADSLRDL